VRLDAGAVSLVFDTQIDWHERRTMAKVAFPFSIIAPRAAYETLYGAVERPTHANTDADLAQYEVPAHRWADLSEPGFGVSLLNDCRYGYATFGSTMSLTLQRGTQYPDATADIGTHHLRYALYPHAGGWREANTVAEALRFNRPMFWTTGTAPILAAPLVTAEPANVIIDTIKPAEDGKGFVIRLYESSGAATQAKLGFGVKVAKLRMSNTLEDDGAMVPLNGNTATLALRPFQIATLRVN
jgi:alpha-mannosidase